MNIALTMYAVSCATTDMQDAQLRKDRAGALAAKIRADRLMMLHCKERTMYLRPPAIAQIVHAEFDRAMGRLPARSRASGDPGEPKPAPKKRKGRNAGKQGQNAPRVRPAQAKVGGPLLAQTEKGKP